MKLLTYKEQGRDGVSRASKRYKYGKEDTQQEQFPYSYAASAKL